MWYQPRYRWIRFRWKNYYWNGHDNIVYRYICKYWIRQCTSLCRGWRQHSSRVCHYHNNHCFNYHIVC